MGETPDWTKMERNIICNLLAQSYTLGCFPLHMFLTLFNADQLELCMHVNIHKNQQLDLKSKTSSLAVNFNFIKGI